MIRCPNLGRLDIGLRTIFFSDTTLRDGEQMPGASLTPPQKVQLAKALARAGVISLDAGFPAAGPDEIEAIRQIAREVPVGVSALCRTLTSDIDLAWEALSECPAERRSVSLFLGASPLHREFKLKRTVPELLKMVRGAIEHARTRFVNVGFSPEDASRTEPEVLYEFYREAIDAGARFVGFPDTVGILTPHGVRKAICGIQDNVPNIGKAMIVGHFHNDLGLATANALAALEAGVSVLQCTVNGIGERAGNTSFEEVVMALALHGEEMGLRTTIDTSRLWELGKLTEELTGIANAPNKPVTGRNVFATEAGIHQDGLLKHPDTYLPYRPEKVGAPALRLVLGKHSGRAAFSSRLAELNIQLAEGELEHIIELAKRAPKDAWLNEEGLLRSVAGVVRAGAKDAASAGRT